jgi:hypothetical protein
VGWLPRRGAGDANGRRHCAFKGAPADAAAETAYFTFPAFEARGYATARAGALLAISATSLDVRP